MAVLLLLHLAAALAAPLLVRPVGRRAFWILALVPAAAAAWALAHTGAAFAEDPPTLVYQWVPSLNLNLSFRLDPLSWLMVLIVGGIGALVLLYSSEYFSAQATSLGRFGAAFVAFAGSMLGLVTTDNLLALYVFWELTTIFSFLLIGHYHERQVSRRAATQAITVTTAGGLAMLAGLIMLGSLTGGSYTISILVENAAAGSLLAEDTVPDFYLPVAVLLILVGAFSKSALVPFHFWLPAAMAAPTPVSAYLHAAAMVKAGIYLVARLAPGFATLSVWHVVVTVVGFATMLLGGYRALKQYDLKLVLAFGTVSQLGMLMALVGSAHKAVALAGLTLLAAHAVFKAALFLTVGIVDWATGTRDLRELSGLGRRMPVTATAAAIAAGSMMGLPPLAGYVGKEAALEGLAHAGAWPEYIALALGSVLTVAYGLRFWFGAFGYRPGVVTAVARESKLITVSPAVLAGLAVAGGLLPDVMDQLLAPIANSVPLGQPGHLTLWGGFGLPLATTAAVLALGILAYVKRRAVSRLQSAVAEPPSADSLYRSSLRGLENLAADVTAFTQRGSLPLYLGIIIAVVVLTAGVSGIVAWPGLAGAHLADSWVQAAVVVFTAVTAFLAARSRRRLKAALFLGASGYGMAMLFASYGAPDLALTQVMVETVSLVIFVLVLRRLPTYFSNRPLSSDRYVRMLAGAAVGITVAVLGVVAVTARTAEPISQVFPQATYQYGYGKNIVNVLLVDTRAWDTMGEISVILVAATGVASLLFLRDRTGIVDPARNLLSRAPEHPVWSDGRRDYTKSLARPESAHWLRGKSRQWLTAGATLAPRRRSLMFEIGTRLIFHTMLIVSLYLLFSGHNQPGGGFTGGLMAGTALIVRYLAGGRYELGEALPLHAGYLLGAGMSIATVAALAPLAFGGAVLQTVVLDFTLPLWGDVHLASALVFDTGVYVLVVGLVLDVLRSLGAEIDRHGELEGIDEDDSEEVLV